MKIREVSYIGFLARLENNRWTLRSTKLILRRRKRNWGKEKIRQWDDLQLFNYIGNINTKK